MTDEQNFRKFLPVNRETFHVKLSNVFLKATTKVVSKNNSGCEKNQKFTSVFQTEKPSLQTNHVCSKLKRRGSGRSMSFQRGIHVVCLEGYINMFLR